MEVFELLVDQQPWMVELRSVSVVSGALSVITPGLKLMPTSSAGNLDTQMQVGISTSICQEK